MPSVSVISSSGTTDHVEIDLEPNKCPFCHHTITAQKLNGYKNPNSVEMLYRCTNQECIKIFIAYYTLSETQSATHGVRKYSFRHVMPGTFLGSNFDERILAISPMFSKIYNQAKQAESLEMDQIAGMGYRKSIEFLIKDYLIVKNPTLVEEIKEKFLGPCINDYIENDKIKEIARRAVWLGNDETHYSRKWEDRDINDLKRLIDITLHWIEMEQRTEEYLREM